MKSWKLLTLAGIFAWAWTSIANSRPAPRCSAPTPVPGHCKDGVPIAWLDEQASAQRYLQ